MTTTPAADLLLPLPAQFWDPSTVPYYDTERRTWHVFSHSDVSSTLTNTAAWSQRWGAPDEHPSRAVMWAADDPRHGDLKAIVRDPLQPRVLQTLAPIIRRITGELIDGIIAAGTGQFEVAGALARPLSGRVICHIMGVDTTEDAKFARWLDEFTSAPAFMPPPQPGMWSYFADLLDDRRRNRRPGLVDQLITAQQSGYLVDGERLSERDLIGYLWGLLAAGQDTTAAGIANMLLFLCEYGHLDELRAGPGLRDRAIEETLRWYPPFPAVPAMARADIDLAGHHFSAGEFVTAWLTAAGRAPALFPAPGVFNIRRNPNPHLAFGKGIHHCLGAALARLEMRVALDAALDRLPGLRWVQEAPFRRKLGIVHGVEEAWLAFDPGQAAVAR